MEEKGIISDSLPQLRSIPSMIMVMGVGGAGGNAVNYMWDMGISGVNMVVCNTDIQDLEKSPVSRKICLGDGFGAGNDAKTGENKAKVSLDEVRTCFEDCGTQILFLTAGMGAGTGTGATPVIAQLAAEMGIVTVAIVTMPPLNDGPERVNQAREGVRRLREYADSIIVLSNDKINELYGNLPLTEAFAKANDIVASATKGIAEIITRKYNIVNNDINDVKRVMKNGGCAIIGMATTSGDERAEKAVDEILTSSLFGNTKIQGTKWVLLNVAVSDEKLLQSAEVDRIKNRIQTYASVTDEDGQIHNTNIIWGASIKADLEDNLEVIIVATGFPASEEYFERQITDAQAVAPTPNHVAPVLPAPEVRTPNKVQSVVPNIVGAPSGPGTLEFSNRNYAEMKRKLTTPAYLRRNVKFASSTSGATRKAQANSVEEETPQQEKTTRSLF